MLGGMSAGKTWQRRRNFQGLSSWPLREGKDLVRNLGVPKRRERSVDTDKNKGSSRTSFALLRLREKNSRLKNLGCEAKEFKFYQE